MFTVYKKKQDFRKRKPLPLYERPDAVAHFPFRDDGHVSDVFRFDSTRSQAFVNMGLCARKKLVHKAFQEMCIGSSNARDYITRMNVSDIPAALHTLGVSITIGLKEAFQSIKGAVDEGTRTTAIAPTVTESEFQQIVQRFVFAELMRRKLAGEKEPSRLDAQTIANAPPPTSVNLVDLEKLPWSNQPLDFDGWIRAMDEIEPLGMGDTPVPTTDKEAVEKLLADVKAPKKKKTQKKYSLETESNVKAKKAYVPKTAQTIKVKKTPVFKSVANVPSKLKEVIDADKAIYRKNREAEKNAAIFTIAKHKINKIMLQSKFQPSEEFLVRERQTRGGSLSPTSARRAREGREIIDSASLWKFRDDAEDKTTNVILSQRRDNLSFDDYLTGKAVSKSPAINERGPNDTTPPSSSHKVLDSDPLVIVDSFLEGNVAKTMDIKKIVGRYNDNYAKPNKEDETLQLVPSKFANSGWRHKDGGGIEHFRYFTIFFQCNLMQFHIFQDGLQTLMLCQMRINRHRHVHRDTSQ